VSATKDPTPEQQRIAQLEALLKASEEESTAKDAIITGKEEQLAAATVQGAGALSVVIHEGKRYQVLAGKFSLKGVSIHHQELKTKPELLKQLIEDNSPLLQLID
jgi:multidrug resistance efflux pump